MPRLPEVTIYALMTIYVTVHDWLANPTDLNPKKTVWGYVKREKRDTKRNTADEQ